MKFSTTALALFLYALAVPASWSRADEVLDQLNALNGVEAKETTTEDDQKRGYRRFALLIEQSEDHFASDSETFKQKLVLFHKDFAEPMVLQTSGYKIFAENLSRVALAFGTNQIQVEHRFFEGSTPASKDWSKLTVRQSAEDFHRVVETFKPLYAGRWVNTGASKGGMTSTYHRRFYPRDLDGTVADVAPLSFTTEDPRYIDFVDQVGGDRYAECRAKLEDFQRTLLRKRYALLPMIQGKFSILGSKKVAYEHAVIELPFIFWQYGNPEGQTGCKAIPRKNAKPARLFSFLKKVNDPNDYSNKSLKVFQPYYYQAAAELGAPATKLTHLADRLLYPFSLTQYLPEGKPVEYTDATMRDVQKWVATEAKSMMFVYGEYDPWSAAAYSDVNAEDDSDNYSFLVPGGNHGSNFTKLPTDARAKAIEVLTQWLGKAPVAAKALSPDSGYMALEDQELEHLRHLRQ